MSSGLEDTPANATRASAWSRTTSTVVRQITNWRDWKLPVKITAAVLVPVIFGLALGIVQICSQIRQADEYNRMEYIVAAGSAVRTAIGSLQQERGRSADFLVKGPVSASEVQNTFTASDRALNDVRQHLRPIPDTDAVRFVRQDTDRQLTELEPVRRLVLSSRADPSVVISSYDELVDVLLALDRTLISQISSSELVSTATTAHELARINEEVQLQQALVLTGLTRQGFTTENLAQLAASESRRTAAVHEFRAAATPQQRMRYDQLYTKPEVPARETSVQLAMAERDSSSSRKYSPPVSANVWKTQSHTVLGELNELRTNLDRQLHDTAFRLRDTASNMAGLESVLLLCALLIAGTIVVIIARHLLGSLALLRRSALDAANFQLPQAVADIRAGHANRTPVERVPVESTDEIGEVARAFDDVHAQAVNLATEQAELRRSFSDSYINVSRRSQSLLERQLRLFEQLERDEEDPDQLATLFQLDHLATRMRRNNETLMVLSGTDLARRFSRPTSPADLIRAAVSEIEHYPRVMVQPLPETKIIGYVAGDLVRLLAELLDNAANFSAPGTQVVVSGELCSDGSLCLDIVDRGIGMSSEELTALNQRLASHEKAPLSASRRMGMFVVSRLATRHGIHVELHPGPDGVGIRATIGLRAELLVESKILTPATRTNGSELNGAEDGADQDTLVEKFDWEAAEQDATGPRHLMHNGFHVFPPRTNGSPQIVPTDDNDTAEPPAVQPPPTDDAGATAPTPIFDGLASAWFETASSITTADDQPEPPDSSGQDEVSKGTFLPLPTEIPPSPPPEPKPELNGSSVQKAWIFANDEARQRAEEVAAAEPADFTQAGLPLRVPQANLVAGSADHAQAARSRSTRDPEFARGRLASFQAGVRRGRHRQIHAGPDTTAPTRTPPQTEEQPEITGDAETPEPTLDRDTDEYTPAGLPRRTPRAHLVPGAAIDQAAKPRRDADLMRGRLASFQRGIREGKHSLREPHSADECR